MIESWRQMIEWASSRSANEVVRFYLKALEKGVELGCWQVVLPTIERLYSLVLADDSRSLVDDLARAVVIALYYDMQRMRD